jgi:hypothetical protein
MSKEYVLVTKDNVTYNPISVESSIPNEQFTTIVVGDKYGRADNRNAQYRLLTIIDLAGSNLDIELLKCSKQKTHGSILLVTREFVSNDVRTRYENISYEMIGCEQRDRKVLASIDGDEQLKVSYVIKCIKLSEALN